MGRGRWNVPSGTISRRNFYNYQISPRANFNAKSWDSTQQSSSSSRSNPGDPANNQHRRWDSPSKGREASANSRHKQWDGPSSRGEESSNTGLNRWENVNKTGEESANSSNSRRKSSGTTAEEYVKTRHKRWDRNEGAVEENQSYTSKRKHSPVENDARKARSSTNKSDKPNPNTSQQGPDDQGGNPSYHSGANFNLQTPPPWQWYRQNPNYNDHGNFFNGHENNYGYFKGMPPHDQGFFQYNYPGNQGPFWQDTTWDSNGTYHVWEDRKPEEQYSGRSQYSWSNNEEKQKAEPTVTEEATSKQKEKDAVPILGSEEERLKTRKATTEWLKKKIENKDHSQHSQLNTILKEKSKKKVSEAQPKPTRKEAIHYLESALDASSIEAVQKNLADVLPDEGRLLTSLLKDSGMEDVIVVSDSDKEGPVASSSTMTNSSKDKQMTSPSQSKSSAGAKAAMSPLLSTEKAGKLIPVPSTTSPSSNSGLKEFQRDSSSSLLTVSKNSKDKFSHLIRLLTKGQLKDRLANPRPGKFEYLLKQLVRKHRLESSREIRLSKDSCVSADNNTDVLTTERQGQEDCLNALPLYGSWSEGDLDTDVVINMNDLPPEFLQELQDALGSGFTDEADYDRFLSGADPGFNMAEDNEMSLPAETALQKLETNKTSQVPLTNASAGSALGELPEVRVKSFAHCRENSKFVSTQQESVSQFSVLVSHKENPSSNEKISVLSYSGTVKTEVLHAGVEADTTVEPPCPLGGPSLLESLASNSSLCSNTALSPYFPSPSPNEPIAQVTEAPVASAHIHTNVANFTQSKRSYRKSANLLNQEVFFSAEDYGKKNKKGRPKDKSTHCKKFPGKAKFVDNSESDGNRSSTIATFIASRSGAVSQPTIPDSTCSEPAVEVPDQQPSAAISSTISANATPAIVNVEVIDSETTEDDGPRSPSSPLHSLVLEDEADEAAMLARVHEIRQELTNIKQELTELKSREEKLIAERSYLYDALSKTYGNSSLPGEGRRKDLKRKPSETGALSKKRKRMFDSSSTSELATSDNDSILSITGKSKGKKAPKKKESKKKARLQGITQANASSSVQNDILQTDDKKFFPNPGRPLAQETITYPKHSLGYYTTDVSLTCDALSGHDGIITQVKVVRKLVLASSSVGKVYLFNSTSGVVKRTYGEGKFPVKCFLLDEKGTKSKQETRLYFGTADGYLHCYVLNTGIRVHPAILVSNDIVCMDSKWGYVYIGTRGGSVMRYSIETQLLENEPISNDFSSILGIALDNEGPRKVLIVASENQAIVLRDAISGLLLRTVTSRWTAPSYKFALGMNMVFCCASRDIFVFSYSNGDFITKYSVTSAVTCMCLWRKVLYVGCADGTIQRFDLERHNPLSTIEGPNKVNVVCMDILENKVLVAKRGGVLEVLNNT